MEQQGTSTPGGASAADPMPGKAAKQPAPKRPPEACPPDIANHPQAQQPQQPGGGGAPETGQERDG
jgi:hypothetical protein